MEHRGLGVPRKIVKLMRERNETEPDLIEETDRFPPRYSSTLQTDVMRERARPRGRLPY